MRRGVCFIIFIVFLGHVGISISDSGLYCMYDEKCTMSKKGLYYCFVR